MCSFCPSTLIILMLSFFQQLRFHSFTMKIFLSIAALAATAASAAVSTRQTQESSAIKYSTLLTDSFIRRGVAKTNHYTEAVLYRGIELAYGATQNQTYLEFIHSQVDGVVSNSGAISGYPSYPFSLDDVRIGTIILSLYSATKEAKYKTAADTLRNQLNKRGVRTPSGGFWHRQPTYPNQMWLDGIYMADVFYAQYTSIFQPANTTAWDDILLQFSLIEQHCRNNQTNLLVHGYDESGVASWANDITGASPNVWDRALGWYLMALVDVLDYFPKTHPGYSNFLAWFRSASAGVLAAQDSETGGWWLVMNEPYPGRPRNYIESSGTAMFIYAILKGVRLGYLDGATYLAPMRKAYEYTAQTFVAFNGTGGTVNWEGTVSVGSLGSDASFEVSGIPPLMMTHGQVVGC